LLCLPRACPPVKKKNSAVATFPGGKRKRQETLPTLGVVDRDP
jgi:hypothetical protein